MITWNNLDKLTSYQELEKTESVDLAAVMAGENGAERVKNYSVPMAEGLAYNYAAKKVDDTVLSALEKLAEEAQLTEKFEALYNGEVVNTGEKRLVLHHMTRGQLGDAVEADGVDKRTFYVEQQKKIAEFANKVLPPPPPEETGIGCPLMSASATAKIILRTEGIASWPSNVFSSDSIFSFVSERILFSRLN